MKRDARSAGDRLLGAAALGAAAAVVPVALLRVPLERHVGVDGRLALVLAGLVCAVVVTLLVPALRSRRRETSAGR